MARDDHSRTTSAPASIDTQNSSIGAALNDVFPSADPALDHSGGAQKVKLLLVSFSFKVESVFCQSTSAVLPVLSYQCFTIGRLSLVKW